MGGTNSDGPGGLRGVPPAGGRRPREPKLGGTRGGRRSELRPRPLICSICEFDVCLFLQLFFSKLFFFSLLKSVLTLSVIFVSFQTDV